LEKHRHIAYGVPGIDEGGGEVISQRLQRMPGVHTVTVWLGEQQIDVDYDPDRVTPEAMERAILQAGYLVQFVPRSRRWPG